MNDIDINLERFANFMADMIEKYGAEIDLSELDDAKAETSVSASFFVFMGKWSAKCFWVEKYRNISVFFSKKGYTRKQSRVIVGTRNNSLKVIRT